MRVVIGVECKINNSVIQSVQLKVTQLLHIVAKLSRLAPPAVGIGGSDQLRSWGSFWVAKTVF